MNTYIIPLTNIPTAFTITLAGINYGMTCKWNNAPSAGWVLDISDSNNNPIVCNLPLITGADMLKNLQYLGFNGSLYVQTNGSDSVPTLDNLGVNSFLTWVTGYPGG